MVFLPGYGAALQMLKVEIGSDADTSEGSEPAHARSLAELANPNFERGYEYWLMKEARRRNPEIRLYGLAWSFPAFLDPWDGE
jgi:galactosylceramidase